MNIYGFLIKAAGVVITFGAIIFFHELGHFLAAKRIGVRVETFSLGFGPEWFGFTKGNTRYRVSLFPLGGYCKMAGENVGNGTKGKSDEFLSQKWWKRIFIVFAGPFMNFILAWLIFTLMMSFAGVVIVNKDAVIGGFLEDSPAGSAGIMVGDKVVGINDESVKNWEHMAGIIHSYDKEVLKLKILREGEEIVKKIYPVYYEEENKKLIGITPEITIEKKGIFASMWGSAGMVLEYSAAILKSVWMMIAGKIKPELAGPIGIVGIIAKATGSGLSSLLSLIASISIMLGLVNLFPIPIVDGGVIIITVIEAIRRKPLSDKFTEVLQKMGFAIIMLLVVFATYQDILRMFIKNK